MWSDFRKSYNDFGKYINEKWPNTKFTMLTATATVESRAMIFNSLKINKQDCAFFFKSFARPNLSIKVIPKNTNKKDKNSNMDMVLNIIKNYDILYFINGKKV